MRSAPGTGPHRESAFRSDVEGLRGIAVLLVVGYHANLPWLAGGFIGVDVFYVLSGYLITGLLVEEIERTGRLDMVQFYARRTRRLLPASAVVLLATVLVASIVYSPLEQELLSRTARATAAYVSNVWFMLQAASYFAPTTEGNPLLHTWSLGVEEQFYVAWPLLVAVAMRGARSRRRLAAVLAAVSLVSFATCLWLTSLNRPWAFFGLPARAWEFAVGGLARVLPGHFFQAHDNSTRVLGWLGLAAVLGAAAAFSASTVFPGVAAMVPVAGTAVVLVGGANRLGITVARVLSVPLLQRLGQLSYSWYLWHWPVITIAATVVPGLSIPARVLCAAASCGLAALTYALVENPVRFNPRLMARPKASLGLAAAITILGVGVSSLWHRAALDASASPQQALFSRAASEIPRLYDDGCIVDLLDERPKECAFGESASDTTVVLFGDSHAAQWFPALERVALERRWRLLTMIKASCPAVRAPVVSRILEREYVECWRWRDAAVRRILELRPRLVVVSSSVAYVRGSGRRGRESTLSPRQWGDGSRQVLAVLDGAGVHTVLIRDAPRPGVDVPSCLARAAWRARDLLATCSFPRSTTLDEAVFRAERDAAEGLHNVSVADLTNQFCTAGLCEPMRDGLVVYRDTNHLTVAFSRSLSDVLADEIDPAGPVARRQHPN